MKKRIIAILMASVVAVSMLAGCGGVQKLGAVWGECLDDTHSKQCVRRL